MPTKKSVISLAKRYAKKINRDCEEEVFNVNFNWTVRFFKRNQKKIQNWSCWLQMK